MDRHKVCRIKIKYRQDVDVFIFQKHIFQNTAFIMQDGNGQNHEGDFVWAVRRLKLLVIGLIIQKLVFASNRK